MKQTIAVLGMGSWGTALAMVLADNGYDVKLWGRNAQHVEEINQHHHNDTYLPGIELSPRIKATTNMESALTGVAAVILVVPSQAMREVVTLMTPYLTDEMIIVHATKGFELSTLKRMSEVIREVIPQQMAGNVAVLSGPSHAEEVAIKAPTTIVVASEEQQVGQSVQDMFINSYFRVYTNPDVIGVELGGALKNIIALAAGLTDGLGYGDNAKAALLTRGIAEIGRLGAKLGANPLTFAGLTGIGDLIATSTSSHSRNWRAGKMIGEGMEIDHVLEKMGMVVEGIKTTHAAYHLSQKWKVDMPITTELYYVLFNQKAPRQAVDDLMGRGPTHEVEEIPRFK